MFKTAYLNRLATRRWSWLFLSCLFICLVGSAVHANAAEPNVGFASSPGQVEITVAGKPVATYFYQDDTISRPFLAHVRAPNGIQVTRNHPPIPGKDLADHGTYHPGIWLAFGDISGSDYWRLAAPVRHNGFASEPAGGDGRGSFAVKNQYLAQDDPEKVVCNEVCRLTLHVRPAGYLLEWDSTFSSDDEFYFGDQEEMGIGFRVATPMYVEAKKDKTVPAGNGRILDAKGRKNEPQIWGNAARWCDYSGQIDGTPSGMTILCHPSNFRPSWFHARDYGVLVGNAFGREAMKKGAKSKIVVAPGESLQLRYGVLLHSGTAMDAAELNAAYDDYLDVCGR